MKSALTPPPSSETSADFSPPAQATAPTLANLWKTQRRAVRRRLGPMLLTAFATLMLTALAAFFWPPTYRSTGTILIEQQEMPKTSCARPSPVMPISACRSSASAS
jgi:uncharacterized protein involved in exopolysaccharide biosynthesis